MIDIIGVFGDSQSINYDFGLKVANSVLECPMKIYKNEVDLNNIPSPLGYPKVTIDFIGKIAGSTTINGNIAKGINFNLLKPPSDFTYEFVNTEYSYLSVVDNVTVYVRNTTNGYIAQQLFSLNLIRAFEDNFGTIPSSVDTASKVAWLKANVNQITCNWYGYGNSVNGNKAYFAQWYAGNGTPSWGTPTSHTNSLTSNLYQIISPTHIDANGFVHFLAYSDASNGTISANIYTDYVKLDITWKDQNNVVWWKEINDQSQLDRLKAQNDGSVASISTLTNNRASAYMIEADLTAISNALGGNSALKSALKAIQADVWNMGIGSNSGNLANGCITTIWHDVSKVYSNTYKQTNNNSSITKQSIGIGADSAYINANNRIFILVYSQYPSDSLIPSQVSLDYLSLKIDIARVADVINPTSINLPRYWAMVIKGISPIWDNTLPSTTQKIFINMQSNDVSADEFYIDYYANTFRFIKSGTGGATLQSTSGVSLKNQIVNILVTVSASGMTMRLLKNNGTVEKYTNNNVADKIGNFKLYIGHKRTNTIQADSLIENISLLNLERIAKISGFTDAEALAILNGTQTGYENPELFDINKVILHANATRSNGVITLNATAIAQISYLDIPVLPNNKYNLKGLITPNNNTNGVIITTEYYNGITVKNNACNLDAINGLDKTFVTGSNTNKVRISFYPIVAGTYTFSGISLKRKD